MDPELKQSPLLQCHLDAGARMVPFAGWNMPVQYEGIIPENKAVRTSLGVFDISHMGQLTVSSSESGSAADWLNRMLSNNVQRLQIGDGQYSFLLNESAGVIDDLIIYRAAADEYFLVVNASRVDQDTQWLQQHLPSDAVQLENKSEQFAGLAIQGPQIADAFRAMFGSDVTLPDRFCMAEVDTDAGGVIVCRTGYTGEDGIELFCPLEQAVQWWNRSLAAGAVPCGLGSRDVLRLEKCYPLNGSDLSEEITPLEAGLKFAVDLQKKDFVGRDALLRQHESGVNRRLAAIRQTGKSPPPRPGYKVFCDGQKVGELTSGGVSPRLGCGISMGYLCDGAHRKGTAVEVEIRGRRFPAEVVAKPFF